MKKEFIPYEQSLALKRLGFNETCFGFYDETNNNKPVGGILTDSLNSAPLYQQAFRWFREEYAVSHIWIMDNLLQTGNYTYEEAELNCLKELIKITKDVESKKKASTL